MNDPESWLQEHGDALFAFALTRVARREVAEELVQETFLAAVKGLASFDQRSSVRTWLVAILRNKVLDHYRTRHRQREETNVAEITTFEESPFNQRGGWKTKLQPWPIGPSDPIEQEEFWQAFDECRSKLPTLLAAAFTLKEIDLQSSQDVCHSLDISPSNLAVRMYRARALLRACLEKNWLGELP